MDSQVLQGLVGRATQVAAAATADATEASMGPDATVLVAPDAEAAGTVPAGEAASLAGEDLAFHMFCLRNREYMESFYERNKEFFPEMQPVPASTSTATATTAAAAAATTAPAAAGTAAYCPETPAHDWSDSSEEHRVVLAEGTTWTGPECSLPDPPEGLTWHPYACQGSYILAAAPGPDTCSLCGWASLNRTELSRIFQDPKGSPACRHILCDTCILRWVKGHLDVAVQDLKCPLCEKTRAEVREWAAMSSSSIDSLEHTWSATDRLDITLRLSREERKEAERRRASTAAATAAAAHD